MQAQIQQIAKNAELDLVIGCVDTRKARRAIDKWVVLRRNICTFKQRSCPANIRDVSRPERPSL